MNVTGSYTEDEPKFVLQCYGAKYVKVLDHEQCYTPCHGLNQLFTSDAKEKLKRMRRKHKKSKYFDPCAYACVEAVFTVKANATQAQEKQ